MSSSLLNMLKLTQEEKQSAGKTVSQLKGVAEFFSDAIDAVKDSDYPAAIAKVVPWAGIVGESIAEAVPPIKFALKLFEGLTKENDPIVLGHIACSLAYERAAQKAFEEIAVPETPKSINREVKKQLVAMGPSVEVSFAGFSFRSALEHEFVVKADQALVELAGALGYREAQSRKLIASVHKRFVPLLKALLSHGELKKKFEPFILLMELDTTEQQAYDALLEHSEYQRWLFEEAPVFEKEPFALAHVYVDTECGKLSWSEIRKGALIKDSEGAVKRQPVDPFSEEWGGRQPLVETLMTLIGDATFNDAIVIQGVAGAGKSSLTLKLCSELRREGLHPIRVRLRDLQLDRHISEALPRALFPPDRDFPPNWQARSRPEDFFLNGKIFDEKTVYRGGEICTYVLILDGWDEISISAAEGFKLRISKMLEELRSEYLRNRRYPVRVILTGRPSEAVSDSKFLRDDTAVLTMRPLQPQQLKGFVESLRKALDDHPIDVDIKAEEKWSIPDMSRFESVFERYKQDFSDKEKEPHLRSNPRGNPELQGSVAVLGLPLLAHLAIRLISRWRGDPGELLENSTTLYRSLVDLTCEKGGKPHDDKSDTEGLLRIQGTDLRSLLWKTAAAMTAYGKESIPFMELALRLNLQEDDLNRIATEATEDHVLTSLMISFFFKGGNTHLGCEFLHKSFREYLFAEGIIELMKSYGRRQKGTPPERQPYWKEFDEGSPADFRFNFSRELSSVLAPQWLRPEVTSHIEQLITWEIERAKYDTKTDSVGTPTERLDFEDWERVRDGLADIWDWWAEGVHLRPQLKTDRRTRNVDFEKTYVQELVESSAPHDPAQRAKGMEPSRIVTMDAHLGDGLIRLCSLVHFQIAKCSGWLEIRINSGTWPIGEQIWSYVTPMGKGPRRCQSLIEQSSGSWILFAPSGKDPGYFANYVSRINSAGWHPLGPFPLGVNLSGVDLRGATISIPIPRDEPEGATIWAFANLSYCKAGGSCFYRHDLSSVNAEESLFWLAMILEADLSNSCFRKATVEGASVFNSNLSGACFEEADFTNSHLSGLDMKGANLNIADLEGAKIEDSDLNQTIGTPKGTPKLE